MQAIANCEVAGEFWVSGSHGFNLGMQACVLGAGIELRLIRAGQTAAGPQKQTLAWVAAVSHMGQRSHRGVAAGICRHQLLSHLAGRTEPHRGRRARNYQVPTVDHPTQSLLS